MQHGNYAEDVGTKCFLFNWYLIMSYPTVSVIQPYQGILSCTADKVRGDNCCTFRSKINYNCFALLTRMYWVHVPHCGMQRFFWRSTFTCMVSEHCLKMPSLRKSATTCVMHLLAALFARAKCTIAGETLIDRAYQLKVCNFHICSALQVTCTALGCPRGLQKQVRVTKNAACTYLALSHISLCCPAAGFALLGAAAAYQLWNTTPAATVCQHAVCEEADDHHFENWSATHKVRPKQLFQPETTQELQQVVADCQASGAAAAMLCLKTCGHLHVASP